MIKLPNAENLCSTPQKLQGSDKEIFIRKEKIENQ